MTTRIRFEVWASDTGETSNWEPVRHGVFFNQENAVKYAKRYAESHKAVCVEAWDDGRNVYLRNVWEV